MLFCVYLNFPAFGTLPPPPSPYTNQNHVERVVTVRTPQFKKQQLQLLSFSALKTQAPSSTRQHFTEIRIVTTQNTSPKAFHIPQECTNFTVIKKPPQNSRRHNSNTKQVPCRRPTNIKQHRTKFGRHGDLAPGLWAPLF